MDAHTELVTRMGGEFARMLREALPRIADGLERVKGNATFSMTIHFRREKGGEVIASLVSKERLPVQALEIKVGLTPRGQLSLFSGERA